MRTVLAVKLLDLTLPSPAENIALDEALLNEAEAANQPAELLRLWEPTAPFVVIGRSSRLAEEVNIEACQAHGIPILRRSSGGAAIVTGPGCLMYAVVLSYELRPQLHSVDRAHEFVLDTVLSGIRKLVPEAQRRGTSDLTRGERKFSGNSLRCKRTHLLYHGTLLYDFPLELVGSCLGRAPRQPQYRAARDHNEFVVNLPATRDALREAVKRAWNCQTSVTSWPAERVKQLVQEKYSGSAWNEQL
jgi:lipoate---protein ligase